VLLGALASENADLEDKAIQTRVAACIVQAGWVGAGRTLDSQRRKVTYYRHHGPPLPRPDPPPRSPADLAADGAARPKRDTPELYKPPPWIALRKFLESPDFCGLTLSPVVAAIAEAADCQPVTTIDEATCRRIFGVGLEQLATAREVPSMVTLIAGSQGGKTTRLGAPAALRAAWCVPAPHAVAVGPDNYLRRVGRPPRVLIIAPYSDLADAAFEACKNYIASSPVLRKAMIEALPKKVRRAAEEADDDEYGGLSRKILLKRPDGIKVEIVVRAAQGRGASARSAPLLMLLLDEACFFEDEGSAVNDAETVRAAGPRLVGPGAQMWLVSTPWEEQTGEAMRLVRERDEAPEAARQRDAVVVGGSAEHFVSTLDLFPDWDADGKKRALLAKDPANYAREVDGIPLPAGSARWFPPGAVDLAFTLGPFSGEPEARGAGGDFAFINDHSAEAIVDRYEGGRYDLRAEADQVPGPGGLKPSIACEEAANLLDAHDLRILMADDHYKMSVEEELAKRKIAFVSAPAGNEGKWDTYTFVRDLMVEGHLRLAGSSEPERLRAQLGAVLKKPLPGGRWQIYVPRSKGRGHGDKVSALVLGVCMARHAPRLTRRAKGAAAESIKKLVSESRWGDNARGF